MLFGQYYQYFERIHQFFSLIYLKDNIWLLPRRTVLNCNIHRYLLLNIDNIGRITSYYDESLTKDIPRESHGEELLNVISYLDKISKNENFRCQQLWLPNVSSTIYLSDLNQKYHHQREAWNFNTVIGEYDEPRRQEQNILKVDLAKGNIAIFGQSGAGNIWQP